MHSALAGVSAVLKAAEHLGVSEGPGGARRIGHVPHVAPEAFLHSVFAPLSESDIQELEGAMGRKLPMDYALFLRETNGLLLFSDSLSIYGYRKSLSRDASAVWQPYSVITPNKFERPPQLPASAFIVGSSGSDGSKYFIDTDRSAARCERRTGSIISRWKDFDDLLAQEAQRFAAMFNDQGQPVRATS